MCLFALNRVIGDNFETSNSEYVGHHCACPTDLIIDPDDENVIYVAGGNVYLLI